MNAQAKGGGGHGWKRVDRGCSWRRAEEDTARCAGARDCDIRVAIAIDIGDRHAIGGNLGSGIAELIAVILLLIPGTVWLGAALALAVMGGAIMSHLTVLGIVVMDDHGLLFGLALTVALCSATLLLIHRRSIPVIGKLLP